MCVCVWGGGGGECVWVCVCVSVCVCVCVGGGGGDCGHCQSKDHRFKSHQLLLDRRKKKTLPLAPK